MSVIHLHLHKVLQTKTDPSAQHFAQYGDHHFCFGAGIGDFNTLTHVAPG